MLLGSWTPRAAKSQMILLPEWLTIAGEGLLVEEGAGIDRQIQLSVETGERIKLDLDLLFFSIRASDEPKSFLSIPRLQHTPIPIKVAHRAKCAFAIVEPGFLLNPAALLLSAGPEVSATALVAASRQTCIYF